MNLVHEPDDVVECRIFLARKQCTRHDRLRFAVEHQLLGDVVLHVRHVAQRVADAAPTAGRHPMEDLLDFFGRTHRPQRLDDLTEPVEELVPFALPVGVEVGDLHARGHCCNDRVSSMLFPPKIVAPGATNRRKPLNLRQPGHGGPVFCRLK